MYSRKESKRIRQEFWTLFGKCYPRKWLLYNTRIKDLSLKFSFTRKEATVSLDIEPSDAVIRAYYYEKLQSLGSLLKEEYLPGVIFSSDHTLDNGKLISRIYVIKEGVNIHKKEDWEEVQAWLASRMAALEDFFLEYQDFIRD